MNIIKNIQRLALWQDGNTNNQRSYQPTSALRDPWLPKQNDTGMGSIFFIHCLGRHDTAMPNVPYQPCWHMVYATTRGPKPEQDLAKRSKLESRHSLVKGYLCALRLHQCLCWSAYGHQFLSWGPVYLNLEFMLRHVHHDLMPSMLYNQFRNVMAQTRLQGPWRIWSGPNVLTL